MKLSAPPPPPPEPNEPGQPAPEPNATPGAAGAVPTPPESAAPAKSRVVTWPVWFAGADFLLAVLVALLAFLVASFVARNSDIWLHLAAGKRLLAGEYTPGSDPFSYSAADRTWVNHSLLFDVGAYLLYGGTGALLVAVKALAVVLAFALLMGLRRTGHSLWPWAAVAGVAVLAVAPRLLLAPFIGSILMLAVTLYLTFGARHRAGSWRFPIAIGATFWVWANLDEWFFLGPLALALILLGEYLQSIFSAPPGDDADESLGSVPGVPALAKALLVGVLACTLNPHHVRTWQLPFELVGSKSAALDLRFVPLTVTPFNSIYLQNSQFGYNLNGLAFAVLFVGGGAALGLAGSRLRFSHLALWLGFAGLSLLTTYAIPFMAVVSVPLIASRLNALSQTLGARTWRGPSGAGRVFVLVLAAVACVLAWPGWVQVPSSNDAFARRVAWAVEPDAGMVKGAEQLQAWRATNRLSPEVRGLITSPDLANYCAWFAPLEKVFVNGRYNHHRPEIEDLITVRAGFGLVPRDNPPEVSEVEGVLRKAGAEYLVVHTGAADTFGMRTRARILSQIQWSNPYQFSPWYLDGRSTICGWREAPGKERPTFAALKLDPLVLAFGPGVEPLRPTGVTPLRSLAGWEDSFLRAPRIPPPEADEVVAWRSFRAADENRLVGEWVLGLEMVCHHADWVMGQGRTALYTLNLVRNTVGFDRLKPTDDTIVSAPFLALRAARRAIAADGDHPDGYLALAMALSDPGLNLSEADRTVGTIAALRQCLHRFPPPERYRPGVYAASPTQVARDLARLYLGQKEPGSMPMGIPIDLRTLSVLFGDPGYLRAVQLLFPAPGGGPAVRAWIGRQRFDPSARAHILPLDLIQEYLKLSLRYYEVDKPREKEEENRQFLKELETELQTVEKQLVRATASYENAKLRIGSKLLSQVEAALENNLVGEALRVLTDKDTDLGELGANALTVALSRVGLELALGRLEDAAADLDNINAGLADQQAKVAPDLKYRLQWLNYHKSFFEGDYPQAGRVMEEIEGARVGVDPNKPLRDQFKPKPYVERQEKLSAWMQWSQMGLLMPSTAEDIVSRTILPFQAMHGDGDRVPGFLTLQVDLQRRRAMDAEFYLRRGLLSLLEGDTRAARDRFLQTRMPADKDWGLPEYRQPIAENYLRLIDAAAQRAPKK